MNATEFKGLLQLDATLKPGDTVHAMWTNSGHYYECPGTIVRLNDKSVVVALSTAIDSYPAGHKITVPRITDFKRWNANNCVRRVK